MVSLIVFITLLFSCSNYSVTRIKRNCDKCLRRDKRNLQINCLTKLIRENPDISDLYFKRAEIYFEINKFSSSLTDYKKVIELEPGNIQAYYALSTSASLADYKEYALYWLEKALESGYDGYCEFGKDPSFANIKSHKKFKYLKQKWNCETITSR